ncbi:MAG: hypothetical protein PVJ15_03505 [Gammaproteobacteria bacterium]
MNYREYVACLEAPACPGELEPCLQALWHDAQGDWDAAHEIVQQLPDRRAARIHAYLHRKEGDEWNSRYWHRQAGSVYPEDMTLEEEWESLARQLLA